MKPLPNSRSHGQEWFKGKDVCEILGFKNADQTLFDRFKKAYKSDLKSLKDSLDTMTEKLCTFAHSWDGLCPCTVCWDSSAFRSTAARWSADTAARRSDVGLYSLIFKSRLPAAKQLKKWVTSELPLLKEKWKSQELVVAKNEDTQKVWKFDEKDVDIVVDKDKKEWFKSKDVCEILGYENPKRALYEEVKQAYKVPIKMVLNSGTNPVSYHEGKVLYICSAEQQAIWAWIVPAGTCNCVARRLFPSRVIFSSRLKLAD